MSKTIYILSPNGELYHCDSSILANDSLCHHGIKGMKWGVRRYQNKDGSLTPAGKKRRENAKVEISDSESQHRTEKSRRAKLTEAQTIRELAAYHKTATDPDFDDSTPDAQKYLALDKEIREFSGDWYNGEGVSNKFKSCVAKYDSLAEACDARHEPIVSKLRSDYHRAELDAQIKYSRNPLNKAALQNGRILDHADWEQAYHKAQNDPKLKEVKAKYDAAYKAHWEESAKIHNKYHSELLGVVLEDLGYKDSPEARRLIEPVVIWD